jgi:hypothetical protein
MVFFFSKKLNLFIVINQLIQLAVVEVRKLGR